MRHFLGTSATLSPVTLSFRNVSQSRHWVRNVLSTLKVLSLICSIHVHHSSGAPLVTSCDWSVQREVALPGQASSVLSVTAAAAAQITDVPLYRRSVSRALCSLQVPGMLHICCRFGCKKAEQGWRYWLQMMFAFTD